MNLIEQAGTILRLARWGKAVVWPDTNFASPFPGNEKFFTPREAARLIRDGDVVAASGLGAHQRASILYAAIVEEFTARGHPRDITAVNIGGHGGRGVLPGTFDELARPGLCARLISSHFETNHRFLELAAHGGCELQCLPLGIIALLYDAQAHGRRSVSRSTGVGTFVDPRCGRGTPVLDGTFEQLVKPAGDRLRYSIPPIDVALFNLPAADRAGNLYARDASMIGDSAELARAAKRNGGVVIANVGRLVDGDDDDIAVPAQLVDAVVYYPYTEQTLGYFHSDPWRALVPGSGEPIDDALAQARLGRRMAELVGAVPTRSAVDDAVVRLAVSTLVDNVKRGGSVVLGTGMPEEVGVALFENGQLDRYTLMVESGAVGGLPAPGGYFGGAFSPREIVSPAEIFKRCYEHLDAACLGALELDADGNVNVSKRGTQVEKYSGPGGFIDFTETAQTLVFVCGWMRGGRIEVDDGKMAVRARGTAKLVERVSEVTFNGQRALRKGQRVFYATPVGLFRLTRRGMELAAVFPGIDRRRDIDAVTRVRVLRPRSGKVRVLPKAMVSGDGFEIE